MHSSAARFAIVPVLVVLACSAGTSVAAGARGGGLAMEENHDAIAEFEERARKDNSALLDLVQSRLRDGTNNQQSTKQLDLNELQYTGDSLDIGQTQIKALCFLFLLSILVSFFSLFVFCEGCFCCQKKKIKKRPLLV